MADRIMTKHPEGKAGVNLEKNKYEQIKKAIINRLKKSDEMTFRDLNAAVQKDLEGKFEGSIGWYYTTVKLDLEARQLIRRVDSKSPQRLTLTAKGRK